MTPVKTEISQSLMNEITTGFIQVVSSSSPEVTRAPGVLATAKDMQALRSFAAHANQLPQRLDQVKYLLGYDESGIPGLEPVDILKLYGDTQKTAELWPYLEINMKEVSAGLDVFAGDLKSVGEDVIKYIQSFDSYTDGVLGDYENAPLDSLPHSPLLASDDKKILTLYSFINELKNLIDEQKNQAVNIKGRITDYKYELIALANKIALKRRLCLTAAENMDLSDINEKIESLNAQIAEQQRSYDTYSRYIWISVLGGLVGYAITKSIYGPEAERVTNNIELLIAKKEPLSKQLKSNQVAGSLMTFEISLQDLSLRIDGALGGATNLEVLWESITRHIMSAVRRFKDTGNATLLTLLVSRLTNMISNWQDVKSKTELLKSAFEYSAEEP
ncbi:alpha-xenorhabdolysin family binary toxin subunit A [Pseudomonas sp. DSP3-2-2]|uniref:alpha-xenorhabdolysin family binary toxin subunit A n=1 Tax=unclassified Pseudomonas TaxID=196821 RepID=UPI003CF33C6E